MKLFKSILAVVALGMGFSYLAFGDAAPANIVTYNGTGSAHNTPVYSLDYTGTQQQAGDLSLGMKGTAANVVSTQADATVQVPIYLSTNSVAAVQGSVIISTPPIGGQMTGAVATLNAAAGLTTVIGIADSAAVPGTVFQIDILGPSLVLTTGTVNVGDLLVSSGIAAGYAGSNNSGAAGAIFGTAMISSPASGALTEVLLHH